MILKSLRSSVNSAYSFLAGASSEAEPLFFSVAYPIAQVRSRLPSTIDADTELYFHLGALAFLGLGYVFSTGHYTLTRKVRCPVDSAHNTLDGVIQVTSSASKIPKVISKGIENLVDKLR